MSHNKQYPVVFKYIKFIRSHLLEQPPGDNSHLLTAASVATQCILHVFTPLCNGHLQIVVSSQHYW